MNAEITFFEKSVTYDKFVTDIAARLASFMKEDKDDPGKIEYPTAQLKELSRVDEIFIRWQLSKKKK